MFAPLGVSYLLTLLASLLVSLTVTPALASLVLPRARFLERQGDPLLLRVLKWLDARLLRFTLRHTTAILLAVAVLVVASVASIAWMGGEFLPEFNEGTLTIAATAPPGTNLAESDRLGTRIERMLMEIPEVTHVARRTGRAELDEHAENVNFSEIDVGLVEPERPLPGVQNAILRAMPGLRERGVERVGRPRGVVLAEIRDALSEMPGVVFNIGQPISHRLDHIMSGIRAQVAVKLFGPDLAVLRAKADEIGRLMAAVPGVVDLQVEPQVDIPQVQVRILREAAARHGLAPADVAESLETALQGRAVSQLLEGQRTFDLVVWFDERSRHDVESIRSTLIGTPSGAKVALGSVAEVLQTTGPNTINRENVVRRIVVQANTAGRDLTGVVEDIRAAVAKSVVPSLPPGYFVEYGGQFEAQQQANRRLLILGGLSVLGIFLLLYKCLDSWQAALQVLVNVPLAAIGSVVALFLVHWPGDGGVPGHAVVAVAARLGRGDHPLGGALGGVHHADRHRLPQRDHDDLPLHPPHAARGGAVRRGDDHPGEPGAAGPGPDDGPDGGDRARPAGDGGGRDGQGDPPPAGDRGHRRADQLDAARPGRHPGPVLQVRPGVSTGTRRREQYERLAQWAILPARA